MFDSSSDPGDRPTRVGYVVKRYPRYSETFIVNEILAHEAAGLSIEIFSIRPPVDTHFQNVISQVRAPLRYLPSHACKVSEFWHRISESAERHAIIKSRIPLLLRHNPADVCAAVALADQAIESGITHFHAHFATSASDVAWLAHRLTDIPFTLTAHAKDIFHEDVDQTSLAEKLRAAKATVTVSDFNVKFLRDQLGEASDKVTRIYNGLDLQHFVHKTPRNRKPIVLAVGRLVEKKGFDVLIDACKILADRNIKFQTWIVGDGPEADDLRTRVIDHDAENYIKFLGPQPQDVVKSIFHDAAVFAAPCIEAGDGNRDGLPTVLLESMALGTPCVSTPVTGIPEAVIDGETGLLVPQHDRTELADALQHLLLDSELRVRFSDAARRHVEDNFDIHRNTALQRRLFENCDTTDHAWADRIIEAAVV